MRIDSERYILIAGLPRSGSTLLQAILNKSDSTYTLPETHFFEEALKITNINIFSKNQSVELLEILQSKWQLSLDTLIDEVKNQPIEDEVELQELYFRVIDSYRPTNSQALIGIEKTPGHLFFLENLLYHCHNLKVVLTTRNPRDFANSINKLYWAPDSIQKIGKFWNDSICEIIRLGEKYPTKVKILDYEDMLNFPESVFEDIYKFLDLKWQNAFLSNLNRNANQFVVSSENDWKTKNLESSNITQPTEVTSLALRKRLTLHRQCLYTAVKKGYLKRYKL